MLTSALIRDDAVDKSTNDSGRGLAIAAKSFVVMMLIPHQCTDHEATYLPGRDFPSFQTWHSG